MPSIKHLHFFDRDITDIALPKKFTFPFYYETHPLCDIASQQVQKHLTEQTDWTHPFTQNNVLNEKAIGKMFGVLVVKNQQNRIGFLSAFSGKLAGSNDHPYFVPPVFDMLTRDSYFLQEETVLNQLNLSIEVLENDDTFINNTRQLDEFKQISITEIDALRLQIIEDRKLRKQQRKQAKETLNETQFSALIEKLAHQSVLSKVALKKLSQEWENRIDAIHLAIEPHQQKIENLKTKRKQKSKALQQYLFKQYQFLNKYGETKNLLDIFKSGIYEIPPAGAGECAAPKLLQYAFANNLTPVSMAEFWWGDSPKSEIRKHGQFYPACQGKCKPILGHMLQGIEMDENPLLKNPAVGKEITIVYEDDSLVVINKPAEFLSVPGKTIDDSVYLRIKQKYPKATGPLIVHRLDMSTSGLMLIAKTKEIHEKLQRQFIKREVKKRYVALLDGVPNRQDSYIDLPLRLDIDDRPRQLVCFEHGKSARTRWEMIEQKNNKTKVYFYPITGRTHQLRVHASHQLGLDTPIVGDDLYGKKDQRLCLHAESISFFHPTRKKEFTISTAPEF
ncbi:pseudouridine synthase [Wenyingzhuangia sp. IMCC45533]